MKRKGFTLIELIGVVVLLSAILLIIIPVVTKSIKNSKDELYNTQIKLLKESLQTWTLNNKPKKGEIIKINLSQLKQASLVAHDIKNPLNNEYLANDMILIITNNDDVITYDVLTDTGTCKFDYIDIPKITIIGNAIQYVEINSNFIDTMASAVDANGNVLNNVTSTGTVDTTTLGNYYITYNALKDGRCNKAIKTVIVTDTIGPVINFNDNLHINLSEIDTFNFLADVTVIDNSGLTPIVNVEKNFAAIKGTYSIKYTATDSSGNISTKYRKVIVN